MTYRPFGPYEIPRTKSSRIDASKDALRHFWEIIDNEKPGLPSAVGCYLFSVSAGRGMLPWYVGKAEKQSFRDECLALHKLYLYNGLLASRKGKPMLTLLPKFTATGRFSAKSKNGHPDICFLENLLIGMGLQRNENLLNSKNTKHRRDMVVYGILNTPQGRHGKAVSELRKLMGTTRK